MAGGTWHNSDGLLVKYGRSEGYSQDPAGVYAGSFAGECVVEVGVDLTELTATETILNDVVTLPAGAHITKVEVLTVEGALTGTAIDVGLIAADRSTEIDYDGLLAAFATVDMSAVGEVNEVVETGLVGTVLAAKGYISASRTDATAFTAGKVRVRVYMVPKGATVG